MATNKRYYKRKVTKKRHNEYIKRKRKDQKKGR